MLVSRLTKRRTKREAANLYTDLNSTMSNNRLLYDTKWLDAGCPPNEYNEETNVDNTTWTYTTNYLIFATGVVLVGCLWWRRNSSVPIMMGYFLGMALSFGIAGIGHQVVTSTEDTTKDILDRFVTTFSNVASGCLLYVLMNLSDCCRKRQQRWMIAGGVTLVIIVINLIINLPLIAYAYQAATHVPLLVIYVKWSSWCGDDHKHRWWHAIKAGGIVAMGIGLILQLTLRSACGSDGYEDCFRNCPLPNPVVFNHNALFHLVFWVGYTGWGIAEWACPTMVGVESSELEVEAEEREMVEQMPLPQSAI